eukprot:TRINITY_DN513_c0_g1_i14.p2 TRINITY_DN513_c0_g1~~TRINITY_DN513_c0_g1_i14.p2  ORF type:complete len:126 (+),score=11.93 TRINITY_DN513_c0_g1_i14:233-610(+)
MKAEEAKKELAETSNVLFEKLKEAMPNMKIAMPKEVTPTCFYAPPSSHSMSELGFCDLKGFTPSSHAKNIERNCFLSPGASSPNGLFSAFRQYENFGPLSQYKPPQLDSAKRTCLLQFKSCLLLA